MSDESLYFLQISDTHIGPTPGYSRNGHVPLPCAQRLVNLINTLPFAPDFVIHTGDVVTDPDPDSYALAAATFSRLQMPAYYVQGNHDTAVDLRKYMSMGPMEELSQDPGVLSYAFEMKGFRFLVLDARGPADIDPQGLLSEEQMDLLRREATPDGPPLCVFLHYPVLPLDSHWMDRNMRVQNGAEVHQALLPARDRLRAVFYGHVHQALQTSRDGILYVAAASAFSQFTAWPGEEMVHIHPHEMPGYNLVHLLPQQTIVHQYTFLRP